MAMEKRKKTPLNEIASDKKDLSLFKQLILDQSKTFHLANPLYVDSMNCMTFIKGLLKMRQSRWVRIE